MTNLLPLFFLFIVGLFSCSKDNDLVDSKERPCSELNTQPTPHYIYSIDIHKAEPVLASSKPSRSISTEWEKGDYVYVFFRGSKGYVLMVYAEGTWTYTAKDALNIPNKEGEAYAIHVPYAGNTIPITYQEEENTYRIEAKNYYYTFSESEYKIVESAVGDTLKISLSMHLEADVVRIHAKQNNSPILEGDRLYCTQLDVQEAIVVHLSQENWGIESINDNVNSISAIKEGGEEWSFYGKINGEKGCDLWFKKGNNLLNYKNDSKDLKGKKSYSIPDLNGDQWKLCGIRLWENGPYWATCNMGANTPQENGDYFAWGATEPWISNGVWKPGYEKGYIDDKKPDNFQDVASLQWGGRWRLPTESDFNTLIGDSCTWKKNKTTPRGYFVIGNNDSIFLPCASFYEDTTLYTSKNSRYYGYYWSSIKEDNDVLHLMLDYYNDTIYIYKSAPHFGMSVRAVFDSK